MVNPSLPQAFGVEVVAPGGGVTLLEQTSVTSTIVGNYGGDAGANAYGLTGATLCARYSPPYSGTWRFRTQGAWELNVLFVLQGKR
jgi:hypothetical protein